MKYLTIVLFFVGNPEKRVGDLGINLGVSPYDLRLAGWPFDGLYLDRGKLRGENVAPGSSKLIHRLTTCSICSIFINEADFNKWIGTQNLNPDEGFGINGLKDPLMMVWWTTFGMETWKKALPLSSRPVTMPGGWHSLWTVWISFQDRTKLAFWRFETFRSFWCCSRLKSSSKTTAAVSRGSNITGAKI